MKKEKFDPLTVEEYRKKVEETLSPMFSDVIVSNFTQGRNKILYELLGLNQNQIAIVSPISDETIKKEYDLGKSFQSFSPAISLQYFDLIETGEIIIATVQRLPREYKRPNLVLESGEYNENFELELAKNIGLGYGLIFGRHRLVNSEPHNGNIMTNPNGDILFIDLEHFLPASSIDEVLNQETLRTWGRKECLTHYNLFEQSVRKGVEVYSS